MLPAISDIAHYVPHSQIDWIVEEAFAEIPGWHPAVDRVLPVALRRWRRRPLRSALGAEWKRCRQALGQERYDCIIDAQGLVKSAWVAARARGPRVGFDRLSVREPLAALSYHRRVPVMRRQHAVERIRQLFAQALDYRVPEQRGDYGLALAGLRGQVPTGRRLVFLHGTTREAKHWPVPYWVELARRATAAGHQVQLLWGNDAEHQRARHIAEAGGGQVLPRLTLVEVAGVLAQARAVVAVDTGLGHLAAALGVPAVSLYGETLPALVGTYGRRQLHLTTAGLNAVPGVVPRAMAPLTPHIVWQGLQPLLSGRAGSSAASVAGAGAAP